MKKFIKKFLEFGDKCTIKLLLGSNADREIRARFGPELKRGQIWEFDKLGMNPFNSYSGRYYQVARVKGGWVQYVTSRYPDPGTFNESSSVMVNTFRYQMKPVMDGDEILVRPISEY